MMFLLYPAAILTVISSDLRDAVPPAPQPPAPAAAAPTFDPDAPPSWWTDKMRQPCTKTGDRVVC